ncbi:hypothetical protein M413DRAFT_442371 [Hebeloma cylindrosporum]|uniref:Uncharacterized protein n=1 Tax=Hebeloma cylindrosporum TaxID=76867 RepID=A0A0C2Y3E5_HEBCY|nr:hypothetical protein M413DRAFT_442371 [Hebeloma cylindrosporum h7]
MQLRRSRCLCPFQTATPNGFASAHTCPTVRKQFLGLGNQLDVYTLQRASRVPRSHFLLQRYGTPHDTR